MRRLVLALLLAHQWVSAAWGAEGAVLVVGDSLSSGFGLSIEESWVSMLAHRLTEQGYEREVVNASISGDTTAGGLSRLPQLLRTHAPSIVVLELGGNDGLRGLPVATLRGNLEQMLRLAADSGARVLLTGIKLPPNYGPAYTRAFERVYTELAEAYEVPLVSFLMEGVALDAALMQRDGIHPNAEGQVVMFENVWTVLKEML
jgi:acyl-CoA thioesterase I